MILHGSVLAICKSMTLVPSVLSPVLSDSKNLEAETALTRKQLLVIFKIHWEMC